MSQDTSTPATTHEHDPAFAALVAAIQRLDDLGLKDEHGRVIVEPATTFELS